MGPISCRPSSASQWLTCTASPQYIAEHDLGKYTSSIYAQEGDLAAKLAEIILMSSSPRASDTQRELGPLIEARLRDRQYRWAIPGSAKVDRKNYARVGNTLNVLDIVDGKVVAVNDPNDNRAVGDMSALLEYIDFVRPIRAASVAWWVEEGVPVWYSGRRGNVDFAAVGQDGILRIVDLKYGAGKRVSSQRNPQLLIYGISLVKMLALETLYGRLGYEMCIFQPRVPGEPIWDVVDSEAAEAEREHIEQQYAIATGARPGAEFVPSPEACKFCPANGKSAKPCPKITGALGDVAPPEIAELVLATADEIPEDLAAICEPNLSLASALRIYEGRGQLKQLLEYAQRRVFAAALAGQIPHLGVFEGRKGNRQWASHVGDEEIAALGVAPRAEPALKSVKTVETELLAQHVTQAEQLGTPAKEIAKMKKSLVERLNNLTYRSPGGPTILPADCGKTPFTGGIEALADEVDE